MLNEYNSKSSANQHIYDVTTYTQVDYPGQMACVVWFSGCNMQCKYCYNPDMLQYSSATKSESHDLIPFLKSRVGLLDAVVLSGGESTLYPNIIPLCKTIKSLGFKIKIDTNGTNPFVIEQLIELGLVDFVALDIKAATTTKVQEITSANSLLKTLRTLAILNENTVPYECRTTVHSELFTEDEVLDCISIAHTNGYRGTYGLQLSMTGVPTLTNMADTLQFNTDYIQQNSKLPIDFRNFEDKD